MTNMSIQPLWLTHFIEILLVLEFQLTKFIVGVFSYKAHFRPQISSNEIKENSKNIWIYAHIPMYAGLRSKVTYTHEYRIKSHV